MAKPEPIVEKRLQELLEQLLEADQRRRTDPLRGRAADEAMIAVCQHIKDHRKQMPPAQVDKALKTIKGLKLMPYWNYCREHMLDIGLEF